MEAWKHQMLELKYEPSLGFFPTQHSEYISDSQQRLSKNFETHEFWKET